MGEAATTTSYASGGRGSGSSSSSSKVAWLWVIEYLSLFRRIPSSLLRDVIDAAPEMPDGEGKATMEMVALRCLEELCTFDDDHGLATHDSPRGAAAPPPLDPSLTCDHALQSILQYGTVEELRSVLGTLDIRPFVQIKRASMPKCTLQRLRDRTLEVSCNRPVTTLSREATDVLMNDDMQDTEPVVSDDCNLSPTRDDKRGKDSFHGVEIEGDAVHVCQENGGEAGDDLVEKEPVNSGSQNMSPLRTDRGEYGSPLAVVTEADVVPPLSGNENGIAQHDFDRGDTLPAKTDESCLVDNQNLEHQTSSIMPEDMLGNGCSTNILLDELGNAETRSSTDAPAPSDRNQPRDSVDEPKDTIDCALKPTSSKGFCQNTRIDEAIGDMEHIYAEDTSSDSDECPRERVDVAVEKDRFLSSQCTLSDDFLSAGDWTGQNLCVRCNQDGQLLVCSTVGCPLVVHENCLGCSPKYKDGNFYCPFCAYSLAISELVKAKKRASLARKKLTAFINVEPPSKGCTERLNSKDSNSRRNQEEFPLQNINDKGKLEDGPGIERHAYAADDHHSRKTEGNPQRAVPPQSCSDANLLDGGQPSSAATPSHNSEWEKERERTIPEGSSVKELNRQDNCVHADPKSDDNQSSEDDSTVKKRRTDEEAHGEFSEQEAAELLGNLASTTDDINDNSNHVRRSRSRDSKCIYEFPAIPQLKRKRVPWTSEEEEMLKEGVQKFSSVSDNMPWRLILDYGSSVFWKGRTAIDLKDKWRNICKVKP